jgi:uncharacterized protein (DUF1778 family)
MVADQEDEALAGTKGARMEQRTTQETKDLIERAAALLGINASEFTVVAAAKAARQTLKEYRGTAIGRDDHEAFLKALDATEPTAELRELMSLRSNGARRVND